MRQHSRTIALAVALLCLAPLAWAAATPEPPVTPVAGPETVAPAAGTEAGPTELDLGLPEPVPTCPTCNEICNAAYDDCMENCTLNPFQCELQCGQEWQNCMATC